VRRRTQITRGKWIDARQLCCFFLQPRVSCATRLKAGEERP
jgi:hypothetical protein